MDSMVAEVFQKATSRIASGLAQNGADEKTFRDFLRIVFQSKELLKHPHWGKIIWHHFTNEELYCIMALRGPVYKECLASNPLRLKAAKQLLKQKPSAEHLKNIIERFPSLDSLAIRQLLNKKRIESDHLGSVASCRGNEMPIADYWRDRIFERFFQDKPSAWQAVCWCPSRNNKWGRKSIEYALANSPTVDTLTFVLANYPVPLAAKAFAEILKRSNKKKILFEILRYEGGYLNWHAQAAEELLKCGVDDQYEFDRIFKKATKPVARLALKKYPQYSLNCPFRKL